ncbi:puromycin-sensitive aminopeptidase [Dacryopinax primogenitus]|uniref:Aminopeptidase n=1 Tax=Dacryopinax primogenitus (strain DJM 731) TaxID=1858805 RepID=M5G0V3_DACPD|nr:puromycin-sensitive aminopeptidase [Dacryopinax primogenitus]EJU01765.1 puromycin-sensitive aminopeptidase [Dacryopinax primogenitus]
MVASTANPQDHVKISDDVTPTHYNVTIRTDLEKDVYDGRSEIDLNVNVATSSITFHLGEPTVVTYAALSSENLKTDSLQVAKEIKADKEGERVTVTFEETLRAGTKAKLALAFKSQLTGSLMGYYKSTWAHEGRKGTYALTQFEPTAARKAMPCWDEPAIKATFDLSLLSRSNTVSLSNMDAISASPSNAAFEQSKLFATAAVTEKGPNEKGPAEKGPSEKGPAGDWTLTKFATTPKMSTYLVAWANGEFKHTESSYTSTSGQKVNLRVYTTPEYITQAGLALDVKVRILPHYERIFDIAYPLPKLDTLVASDFDAGAMENWGLITGRTSAYLYDPKTSGINSLKQITETQSHEVAHQWFGNIVTMKWWDNLWLNEAFATLMGEVIIIQQIHPEWRPHAEFINMHLDRALNLDSLRSSHPIEVPCPDEKAINQIFDAISYSKGASVLRMLSSMIGEEVFLKGVSKYLKSHLYSNSVTADLWRGISEASGINVNEIMASWTLKVGYPLIQVSETASGIKAQQTRFLATNDLKPEEDETLWHVPLNILTVGAGKAVVDSKAVLTAKEATFDIPNVGNSLYKLNAGTTGVYRVLYPPEHLSKLGDEAARKGSSLTPEDRMGLVSDAFVLARSGHGSTSAALDLIKKLRNEDDYLVWSRMANAISEVGTVWWEQPEDVQDGLFAFRRSLFGPLAEKLGFEFSENDSPDLIQWRITAITNAANANDPKTIAKVKRRFNFLLEKNDASQIAGDLQRTIYANAVRLGGVKEWEKVLEIYRHFETPSQKTAAMIALCRSTDPALVKRTLDLILTEEVKTQDYMYFIAGSALNPSARREVWQWVQTHLSTLVEKFKGNFSLGRVLQYSFDSLTTFEDVKAIERFFKDKDTSTYVQALSQGLDDVRSKAAWLERDRAEVEQWLKKNSYL